MKRDGHGGEYGDSEDYSDITHFDPRGVIEEFMRTNEALARELETKGRIGQMLMLRANPGLRDYLEYRDAQQSVRDAQESAFRNEGRDIVLF